VCKFLFYLFSFFGFAFYLTLHFAFYHSNLPAHTVVIKGTEVYNPEKGGITDLSILDVQQIFGRAGRPQFDTSGEATLITFQENFQRYMDKLVRPIPIESNFVKQLPDHLNAEVVSGTVSNLKDAATWLTYTYLYVRMLKNPLAYGINSDEKIDDPRLHRRCHELVANAARFLNRTKMLRLHEVSGELGVTNNGRVAAHYYIQAESMETFNDLMIGSEHQNNESLCMAICSASEFRSMRLRAEEMDELQKLVEESCPMYLKGAGDTETGIALVTSPVDKAFVLLQAYIGRVKIKSFTLVSDMNYIASNAARVARALFEICLKSQSSGSAVKLLRIAKSIENQRWWFQTPLRHFESELSETVFVSLESSSGRSRYDTLERLLDLLDMQAGEVGSLCVSNAQAGGKIQSFIRLLPRLVVECDIKPVSGSLLICRISLLADFAWNNRWHGVAQSFWVWVEDTEGDKVFHCEQVLVSKINSQKPTILSFSLPLFNSSSRRYTVRTVSDVWAGIEQVLSVPLANITIPTTYTPYTALLNLTPLPTSALGNAVYKQLYSKFSTFNPVSHLFPFPC
jgi:activating signal cointegrator complex subunit 3